RDPPPPIGFTDVRQQPVERRLREAALALERAHRTGAAGEPALGGHRHRQLLELCSQPVDVRLRDAEGQQGLCEWVANVRPAIASGSPTHEPADARDATQETAACLGRVLLFLAFGSLREDLEQGQAAVTLGGGKAQQPAQPEWRAEDRDRALAARVVDATRYGKFLVALEQPRAGSLAQIEPDRIERFPALASARLGRLLARLDLL